MSENYLEKAWGGSLDNVNINDVKEAINETLKMDDEHGAFWVSIVKEEENVLEMSKNLRVIGIFEDEENVQYKAFFKNIEEIIKLYELFLEENFNEVKKLLEKNKN